MSCSNCCLCVFLITCVVTFHSDLDKVQAGIGDKLSIFFQWITTFFAGLVIGFTVDYRLTLVILGITPFLVAAAFVMAKACVEDVFRDDLVIMCVKCIVVGDRHSHK